MATTRARRRGGLDRKVSLEDTFCRHTDREAGHGPDRGQRQCAAVGRIESRSVARAFNLATVHQFAVGERAIVVGAAVFDGVEASFAIHDQHATRTFGMEVLQRPSWDLIRWAERCPPGLISHCVASSVLRGRGPLCRS